MEYGILGPLEVLEQGEPVPLGGGRQRALLALLLLHANEVVSTDRLVDELWAEEAPATAGKILQVYVSQLRKALGASALITRAPGYLLRVESGELDLDRFEDLLEEAARADAVGAAEKLREALALWRGGALADLAYEPFAQVAIARFEELRLAAVEKRIDADLALGRHADVVGELEGLTRLHPLRERLRAQLMLALYRSGRQAEALEAYREARQLLADELGLEPGEALRQLERAILAHDPSLSVPLAPGAEPTQSAVVVIHDRGGALEFGRSLTRAGAGPELIVVSLVPPGDGAALAKATEALRGVRERLAGDEVRARVAAFTSPDPGGDIVRLATEQDAVLLLVDIRLPVEELTSGSSGDLLAHALCDVGLVVRPDGTPGSGESILVPFGAAYHDWAALELGAWLARRNGMPLRLLGALGSPAEGARDASRLLADASLIVQRSAGVVAEPMLAAPGIDGMLATVQEAAVFVVGLSERWRSEGLGEVRAALAARVTAPLIFVRRGRRPGGLAPPQSRTRFSWSLVRR